MENKELCVHNRNSRVLWIDNARGILFFIVMIYHTFIDPDLYRSVYAPIFLTGFFFISGVLYKKKESIYKNLESITNNILIPFFIFSIVLSAYESVRIDSSFAESFKEIFIKGGDVIWFLPCLIVVEGIYILLDRIMQRKFLAIIIIFISGTTFLYSINNSPDHLFWNIDTAMYAILYFWMGNLYSQHAPINTDNTLTKRLRFNCLTTLTSRKILLLGGVIYVLVCLALTQLGLGCEHSDLHMNNIENKFSYLFLSMIGCILYLECIRVITPCNLFVSIGQYSLFMFPFHSYVMRAITRIVNLNETVGSLYVEFSWISVFVTCTAGALVLVVLCRILERFCPFLLGKYKYIKL